MAKLIIINGTRGDAKGLCYSCTHSFIRKGAAQGDEVITCQADFSNLSVHITYPIVECSSYYDKSLPSIREMKEIAYFINSNKQTGKVGFTHADKLTADEKEKEIEDPFQ